MKLPTRRMTFQLTPLLDLLLIVIFAQFIEVRDTTSKSEELLETQKAEARQKLMADAEELRRRMDAEFADRMTQVDQKEESLLAQHEQAGRILSELFNVPQQTVERLLRIDSRQDKYTPQQREQLKQTLRNLQKRNGPELLKMLISYGEMQKRCDIWEVHVSGNESLQFAAGDVTKNIRAKTQEEIEDELFKAYKSLPEPRTLVIILFSYGNTNAGARRRAEEALPNALARMRADSGGRNWFEFAILGFAPEGPSLKTENR